MNFITVPREEHHLVAKVFVAVLIVVVLEGAIRKWILPGSAAPLLAIRDSLVVYAIAKGITKGWYIRYAWQENLLLAWSILVIVWAFVQMIFELQPVIVGLLGLRFWLLYLWFAWLCARTLTAEDIQWILRITIYCLIPITALAVIQHFLPPGHILNRQAENDGSRDVFTVVAGIVRTTGTFSFTAGYVKFVAFASTAAIAAIGSKTLYQDNRFLYYAGPAAFVIAAVVSGARHAIIFAGIAFGSYAFALLAASKRSSFRIALVLLFFGCFSFILLLTVFGRAVDAMTSRFETASVHESLSDRIVGQVIGGGDFLDNSLLGNGIGIGTNAAPVLMGMSRQFLLAETEPARLLAEAGLLGGTFIFVKIGIILFGLKGAFRKIRREGDTTPWMLWTFVTIDLLTAQIVGQVTVNAFAWMGLGLAWASIRCPGLASASFRTRALLR